MKPALPLVAVAIAAVIVIVLVVLAVMPSTSEDSSARFQQAGALYTKSVDLANEGKYEDALAAADQALALNSPQLTPIIQSNRAGILVMLGKNTDALAAADAALSSHENLTTTYSVAYFNKGNALKNLGRMDEARAAYARAHELDPALVSPI
jgi:tetratricopeptide (TPR) repeat protein